MQIKSNVYMFTAVKYAYLSVSTNQICLSCTVTRSYQRTRVLKRFVRTMKQLIVHSSINTCITEWGGVIIYRCTLTYGQNKLHECTVFSTKPYKYICCFKVYKQFLYQRNIMKKI